MNGFPDGIIKQSVDREIPAQHVCPRVGEYNAGRTPAVDISLIGTKRRDFERMPAMDHQHDAKLRADRLRFAETSS